MSAVQLSFNIRTSASVKTVHLLGSWDTYSGQLPLSKDSSKSGAWKGTFRFQGTLKPGKRYWYYYIMDGYHVSHDPAKPSTTEPTTGRELNILDVPSSKSSSSSGGRMQEIKPRHASNRNSVDIPKGRSLSPSMIQHPRPNKPYASRKIREADYSTSPVLDDLSEKFEQTSLYNTRLISPTTSISSSVSSGRSSSGRSHSGGSSPSSLSSLSDRSASSCRCNRYGITRGGDRIKLDCGGARCGYSDDSSSACSSSDDECRPSGAVLHEIKPRTAAPASRKTTAVNFSRKR